ncbi:hypothetical protein A3860_12545 [Niastella vici]|uniref:FAS1 domain-containing protein n=1 Tax=Niastella vici TaxID=1703345 RepID=A0A1V9G784_9BACT|nr:hypothetical protein [Niastella vici]OQP66326.1 hypothetical protein A3860_12545 [Niastella vici]
MKTGKAILLAGLFITAIVLFTECKKDYITGGSVQDVDQYTRTTTYDVLKSNALYDTLVQLIDAAGLKSKINESNNTFFAPSDYSVRSYLNQRTLAAQAINQYAQWGMDSLIYYLKNNIKGTADSLRLYLIHKPLNFSVLTSTGAVYPTELAGDSAIVSWEFTRNSNLGYSSLVSGVPQLVYFTQLWHHYDVSEATPAGDVPPNIGVHTLCKTSGIITQTGIMNALDNSHILFFYGTKK